MCLARASFLTLTSPSSHCVPSGGGDEGALWGPYFEATDPLHEGSTLTTQSPPKGPTSSHPHMGVRFQPRNLGSYNQPYSVRDLI